MVKQLNAGAQWFKRFLERHPTVKSTVRIALASFVTAVMLELGLDSLAAPVADLIKEASAV